MKYSKLHKRVVPLSAPQNGKIIKKAITMAGGPAKVGRACGVTSQAVTQWQQCPAPHVLVLEKMTKGEITRHQLRPDIFGSAQ